MSLQWMISVAGALALTAAVDGADPAAGRWRAVLHTPGGELPFGLEVAREGEAWRATILNGVERIDVPSVVVGGGEATFAIDSFDAKIVARVRDDGLGMEGQYFRTRGPSEVASIPFTATHGGGRFLSPPGLSADAATPLAERWLVRFAGEKDPAIGQFVVHPSPDPLAPRIPGVTGTFLTTTGDYRYLEGDWDGRTLRLSVFDGAHAFLFHATMQPDGSLKGDFWSGDHFHDAWSAIPDAQAALPDPWSLNEVKDPASIAALSFPDVAGVVRSLGDAAFAPAPGGVRIIEVFGTWCPNCLDATRHLVELKERHGDRLSVVGLAFELTGDAERDRAQVATYAARHGVNYPILVAGMSDKARASAAFPALDRVKAYPTVIFLDDRGRVRGVYTGYSGPATGVEHAALRKQWDGMIERILSEPRSPARD